MARTSDDRWAIRRRRPAPGRHISRARDRRPRAAWRTTVALVVGMALLPTACGSRTPDVDVPEALPTRVLAAPTVDVPTPIARASGGAAAPAVVTAGAPAGEPTAAITATRQVVTFEGDLDARPGPWAPDGQSLVAFALVGAADGTPTGTVGRVWTVDAGNGAPRWDSGDVQDMLEHAAGLAAWRADGVLVLPRADGMLVGPDGVRTVEVVGIAGQPREVGVSPDGETVFANGPDGAWLVDSAGRARAVTGRPPAGFDNWSWHPDATSLGAAQVGGGYFVVDVATGAAEKVAEAEGVAVEERVPPPRFLASGQLLLTDAARVRARGGAALDHRLVMPDGERSRSLPGLLDLPLNVAMPHDASPWVSPDGAWVVYPQTEAAGGSGGDVAAYRVSQWWLIEVAAVQKRALPVTGTPLWAPDSRRVSFADGDRIVVFRLDDDVSVVVASPEVGVADVAWSPDSRWVVFADGGHALWIVPADGSMPPVRMADRVAWSPGITWSPAADRFAATLLDSAGIPHLTLFTLAQAVP